MEAQKFPASILACGFLLTMGILGCMPCLLLADHLLSPFVNGTVDSSKIVVLLSSIFLLIVGLAILRALFQTLMAQMKFGAVCAFDGKNFFDYRISNAGISLAESVGYAIITTDRLPIFDNYYILKFPASTFFPDTSAKSTKRLPDGSLILTINVLAIRQTKKMEALFRQLNLRETSFFDLYRT